MIASRHSFFGQKIAAHQEWHSLQPEPARCSALADDLLRLLCRCQVKASSGPRRKFLKRVTLLFPIEEVSCRNAVVVAVNFRPDHDQLQKDLFAGLSKAQAAWSKLHSMKRGIVNQGMSISSLFAVDAEELLGIPGDRSSEFNHLMNEAAAAGYCKKVIQ